jgi:hypothetical protein
MIVMSIFWALVLALFGLTGKQSNERRFSR